MQNRRFFLPAGSAVAAAVVLLVLFATPSQKSVVNAKMIMTSLSETTHYGLRCTIEDIKAEEVMIDGQIAVVFNEPFSLAELIGQHHVQDPQPHGVYFDFAVTFGPDADELAGLDLNVAGGLADQDDQWVYLRFNNIEPLLEKVGPPALIFAPMLRAGLLLELEGMFDEGNPFGIAHTAAVHDAAADAHDEAHAHLEIGARSVGTDESSIDVNLRLDDDPTGLLGDAELEALLMRFLTGEAAPEELQTLIASHEELEGHATVEEVEPGLHVLTIRDFDELVGEEDEEMLANAIVQIAYREGVGIEWVRVENVGNLQGSVHVEFIDELDGADLLNKQDYIEEGVTTVINAADLLKNIESMTGSLGMDFDE
jgi:hypothetical protein